MKKLLKSLYSKYKTYGLQTLPYRQYIFEVKFKNIKNIVECKSTYLLSSSYNTFLEELYEKGYIEIENKQYSTTDIEYTKLLKTNVFYAYVFDSFSDKIPLHQRTTLQYLVKRQKEYFKYAKYFTPQKLKKIINHSKNYYV